MRPLEPTWPINVAAVHFLPGVNRNLGQMRVIGLQAAAVIHDHQASVAARHHLGLHHDAIRGGAYGGAGGRGDIYAFMEGAFPGERIGAVGEAIRQAAFHRPETGRRIHSADAARAAVGDAPVCRR